MKPLTVQDIIDLQSVEQALQEPTAVAKATGKTLDEVLAMTAAEYMPCRQQVLEMNGLA